MIGGCICWPQRDIGNKIRPETMRAIERAIMVAIGVEPP